MFTRFILVFLLTIVTIVLYQAIKPYKLNQPVNYQSIPKVFPSVSKIDNVNCDVLTPCAPDGTCKSCGMTDDTNAGTSYVCTHVTKNLPIEYRGQSVPPGTWCLPAGLQNLQCGTHTGKFVWSKNKGWYCTCLYPNLFGGRDCMTQLACRIPGLKNREGVLVNQSTNVLKSKLGEIWDPNNEGFNPSGKTPYDKDSQGEPYFTCSCDNKRPGVKFVNMKGDPYRCHKDPCTPQGQIPFYNSETNQCECEKHQVGQYIRSNVTQRCVKTNCNYNYKTKSCSCPEGQVSLTCNSRTMKRSDPEDGECPAIPAGIRCKDPCKGYCSAGATPSLDVKAKKCTCKCRESDTFKFSGDRCEKSCVKDGVKFDDYNRNDCCGRSRPLWGSGSKCVSDSCFTGEALVSMADGSYKQVDKVVDGDFVLSATGIPTMVLFVDQVMLEDRYLVGLKGTEPFVTEDHCFYGDKGQRLAFNPNLAQFQKHWSSVKAVQEAYPNVYARKGSFNTKVYDIITEAHTLMVNDIPFYDEMPEVELHPEIAIVIFLILQKVVKTKVNIPTFQTTLERHCMADKLFSLYGPNAIKEQQDTKPQFKDCYEIFFNSLSVNNVMIRLAATLWERWFHKIKCTLSR